MAGFGMSEEEKRASQLNEETITACAPAKWCIVEAAHGYFYPCKVDHVGGSALIIGIGSIEWCEQWLDGEQARMVSDFNSTYSAYCD